MSLKDVAPLLIVDDTIVPTPALGAEPLLAVKVGVAGLTALKRTYPFVVAPDPGKVAADQLKLMSVPDVPVAVSELACAVAGLESVVNVMLVP